MSQSCFSLGFLSQNSLWKLSLNRGYKGIYIVGWKECETSYFAKQGVLAAWPCDCVESRANGLASLRLLSCSTTVGVTLQHLACLARVHHFGGLQPRATRKIQPQVLASLHKLDQFFTLSHTLPLHDSHLNTGLLIAKIQANLARNKANKMID